MYNLIEHDGGSGFAAWRRLAGRFSPRQAVDHDYEYEEVVHPLSWLSKAKSVDQALDVLLDWEAKLARYENKYCEKIDERAKTVALKQIMPAAIFGGQRTIRIC